MCCEQEFQAAYMAFKQAHTQWEVEHRPVPAKLAALQDACAERCTAVRIGFPAEHHGCQVRANHIWSIWRDIGCAVSGNCSCCMRACSILQS